MDIYDYINSCDVAAYCRELNHAWNTFDMAVIIGISNKSTAEKHKAWRELISDYPDMPTPTGYHHESYPSLHTKLAEAIEYEELYYNRTFELFKTAEQGAVYVYAVIWGKYTGGSTGEADGKTIFTTFESAFADVKNCYDENDEVRRVKITKCFLDDVDSAKGKITAYFDYGGNLIDIDIIASAELRSQWFPDVSDNASRLFRDDFYVIIPIPFKRGDILTYACDPKYRSVTESDKGIIFVLDSIDHHDPRHFERRKRYEGDRSDMNAWGFFVDDNGVLYGEHAYCYDCLEYYRGKLEDKERLLHYVNLYIRGEIHLPNLMAMQCRIMLQHQLDNGLCVDTHGRYIPDEYIINDVQA
jgi:hypothetical protein